MDDALATRSLARTYDGLPYESEIHQTVHPVRLSSAARRRGVTTAPIGGARVLELGCAQATDLILIADSYPDATFVGVDISERHVEVARTRVGDLGLENLKILHGDIETFDESLGPFDYIICHGIYSWVPERVRSHMLELCGRLLAPGGVANVSYNVLPGWHSKRDLRDLLLAAIEPVENVRERPAAAREVMSALKDTLDQSPYGVIMNNHIESAMGSQDWYLAHDFLEVVNHPVYLTEFVQHAAASALRYLADLSVTNEAPMMGHDGHIPRTPADVVGQQQTDLLRGQVFRSAVLCREDEPVPDSLRFEELLQMHVTSRMAADTSDPNAHKFSVAGANDDRTLTIRDPDVAVALTVLGQIFPRSMRIDQLIAVTAERGGDVGHPDEFAQRLINTLLELSSNHPFSGAPLEILAEPFPFVSTVGERPEVSAAARYFLGQGSNAMTRRHETGSVDDSARFALQQLDGSNTIDDVASLILAEYAAGRLTTSGGTLENAESDEERRRLSRRMTDHVIDTAVKIGLLVR